MSSVVSITAVMEVIDKLERELAEAEKVIRYLRSCPRPPEPVYCRRAGYMEWESPSLIYNRVVQHYENFLIGQEK